VAVLHTADCFESTTSTTVKAPWWWHPWSAKTCICCVCIPVHGRLVLWVDDVPKLSLLSIQCQ